MIKKLYNIINPTHVLLLFAIMMLCSAMLNFIVFVTDVYQYINVGADIHWIILAIGIMHAIIGIMYLRTIELYLTTSIREVEIMIKHGEF